MKFVTVALAAMILMHSAPLLFAKDDLSTRVQTPHMGEPAQQSRLAEALYTPVPGSPERTAIMDAIRLATGWRVKFKVAHLVVARIGARALAVADVSDASNQSESSGVFELEGLSSQWRALYSVGGGGGADDCKTEQAVLSKMVLKAQQYADARKLFPESFWRLARENRSEDDCWGTVSFDFSNSRQ